MERDVLMRKRLHLKIKRMVENSEKNLEIMRSERMTRDELVATAIDLCGRQLKKEMKGKTKKEIKKLVEELIVT